MDLQEVDTYPSVAAGTGLASSRSVIPEYPGMLTVVWLESTGLCGLPPRLKLAM